MDFHLTPPSDMSLVMRVRIDEHFATLRAAMDVSDQKHPFVVFAEIYDEYDAEEAAYLFGRHHQASPPKNRLQYFQAVRKLVDAQHGYMNRRLVARTFRPKHVYEITYGGWYFFQLELDYLLAVDDGRGHFDTIAQLIKNDSGLGKYLGYLSDRDISDYIQARAHDAVGLGTWAKVTESRIKKLVDHIQVDMSAGESPYIDIRDGRAKYHQRSLTNEEVAAYRAYKLGEGLGGY